MNGVTDRAIVAWYGATPLAIAVGAVLLLRGRAGYVRLVAGACLVIFGIAAAVVLTMILVFVD